MDGISMHLHFSFGSMWLLIYFATIDDASVADYTYTYCLKWLICDNAKVFHILGYYETQQAIKKMYK